MLFDILFYSILISSSIGCIQVFRSQKKSSAIVKALKGLLALFVVLQWIWVLLLCFLPKGSQLEEAIHLPRHLWMLDHASMEDGIGQQKITYGTHPRQYYIYYPAPKDSPNANTVIFYIHGGGWCLGGPHQHLYLAKILQEQGYALIFTAYRLCPEVSYPELQKDINSALIHSLDFLTTQQVTNPNLIIGGTSAGANLATLLAYDEQRWETLNLDRSRLKGVFSIVGALDLDKMSQSSTLMDYTGPFDGEQYKLANPITWINDKDQFPFLCLHGDCDCLAPYENAVSFCQKVQAVAPNAVDFRTYKNASHLDLGSSWYYTNKTNYGQDTVLMNWLNRVAR